MINNCTSAIMVFQTKKYRQGFCVTSSEIAAMLLIASVLYKSNIYKQMVAIIGAQDNSFLQNSHCIFYTENVQ